MPTLQKSHPSVATKSFADLSGYANYRIHERAYKLGTELARGRSVLDWGCNNGYGMEILSKTAAKIAGLDSSQECIREARSREPEFADRIQVIEAGSVPFTEERFDLIVSFQVIEHVENRVAYLSAIQSRLSSTGLALFTTPNRMIRLDEGMKPWNPFHVTEFSAITLRGEIERHFESVWIFGMQGDEGLLRFERERYLEARNTARRRAENPSFKDRLRAITPEFAKDSLRTLRGKLSSRGGADDNGERLSDDELRLYAASRLGWTRDNLDSAIDLLAIGFASKQAEQLWGSELEEALKPAC